MNVLQRFFETIVPFLVIGLLIAVTVAIAIMMFYVLLWGVAIGLIIYAAAWVKNKVCPAKQPPPETHGRVIEHDSQ